MNTLKTLVVLTVLVMVGYGLYVGLNNGFQFENPPTETPEWLKREIDSGSGIPQVTPPQVTSQLDQGSAAANNVSLGQPVAGVPTAQMPTGQTKQSSVASTTVPAAGVPRAEYPANSGTGSSRFNPKQPTTSVAGPVAVVPKNPTATNSATPVAPVAPVALAPGSKPNSQTLTAEAPLANVKPLGELDNGTAGMQLPAAVGTVPDMPLSKKLNLSQDLAFTTAMKSARLQLQQGQLATSLLTLSIWYEDPRLNDLQQQELTQLLDQVAGSVIYSRKHLIEPAYTVRQGETLDQIAKAHRVTAGLLIKINGIQNPETVRPGDQLKVVRGPFNATVNGEKSELTLWLGGRYAGRFPLAMGPEFKAIVGPFVVHEKIRVHPERGNQPWIRLAPGYGTSSNIPPADPQVGIAGMQRLEAVSQGSNPGQIGVSLKDANDLFDILSRGSKVTIQR